MSNVKDVEITGRVPYDWPSHLSDEDGKFMAGLFLNPVIGLHLEQVDDGYDGPNEHGGKTSMFKVFITGQEALAWPCMDRIVEVLNKVGEAEGSATDIEDGDGVWEQLSPVGE